jgi:murein DD-endopeptidase MepM/ murein hydrolase activator NlpD
MTYTTFRSLSAVVILTCIITLLHVQFVHAESTAEAEKENIYEQRFALYKKTEAITAVPWYYLAAIDQYERNKEQQDNEDVISIQLPEVLWFGLGNVGLEKDNRIVKSFNGIGLDGNDDGLADPNNEEDMLLTIAHMLSKHGLHEDDIKISLWEYYHRDLSVKTIINTAKVLRHFKTNELTDRAFPVATNYNYSYRSTWGAGRGFGGNRIHEGTDIFAGYGTPVKSTTYGVVELMGWNLYGGWRIGIRDIYNIYHYYGHLQNYSDDIHIGDIVKPGDLLGTVGATGYGPPGTSGKFPPHLHYGMYKDNGRNEWSFDPYPYLVKWERMEKSQ